MASERDLKKEESPRDDSYGRNPQRYPRDQRQDQEDRKPAFSIKIPTKKREHDDTGGPDTKRRHEDPSSSSSAAQDSFKEFMTMKVQLNSWDLDISKMDKEILRILFQVTLIQNDGTSFILSDGIVAVSGDVNRQIRRQAQVLLFEKWFSMNTHLFYNQKNSSVAAYDAADTFFVGKSNFSGGGQTHTCELKSTDFSADDWKQISRLSRRRGCSFSINISPAGSVNTRGPEALSINNRPELTRCIETVTNQILHSKEFLLYNTATFSVDGGVLSNPDEVTEIKSGFSKVTKITTDKNGHPKAIMTVDIAKSAFFKSQPLLKFVCAKWAEFSGERRNTGFGGRGGGRGGGFGQRGGRGGGGGFRGNDNRFGGRGGDRRDSYGGDRRDSYGGDRRDNYGSDRRGGYGGDRRDNYGGDRRDDHRGSYGSDRRDNYGEDRRDDRRDREDRRDDSHRGRDESRRPEEDYDVEAVEKLHREFKEGRADKRKIEELRKALKRLECDPIHLRNKGANRSILIDSLHNANSIDLTFEKKDKNGDIKETTIADYFLETYNYKIKFPYLPLIISKNRKQQNCFPMELLFIIPGQRIKTSQMTPDIQSHMTGRNSSLPAQHIEESQNILKKFLNLGDRIKNDYLDAFNIRFVSSSPITTQAKVLAPPSIRFNSSMFTPDPSRDVKIANSGKFVKPAEVSDVVVVNYDGQFRDVEAFCDQFARNCGEYGISFKRRSSEWKIVDIRPDDTHKTKEVMEKALRNRVTIVIGIAYDKKPEVHDILKYYEELLGQQTMQITTDTARKISNRQGGRQTIDNVIRKFNPKCGGTNFFVELPEKVSGRAVCRDLGALQRKLYDRVQFIGFELSHTGSRTQYDQQKNLFEGDPTCVGVAYSLKHSASLGGFSYYQDTRIHKLTRLKEKFSICIEAYQKSSKALPETIVIYRIGSGEGDYEQVKSEVGDMRNAANNMHERYNPKFVVVMAQRNSRVRVFRDSIDARGKSLQQNVPSGTCVENTGASHDNEEFILCCQTPLIGTIRPTRYTIIVNDAGWTKNEVMNVTYQMAFGHQVSFAPPAVPHILYAAENLAKRGHNNYKVHTKLANMRDYAEQIKKDYEVKPEDVDEAMSNYINKVSDDINNLTISGRNFWA